MKRWNLLIILFFTFNSLHAQNSTLEYSKLVSTADSLYKLGAFKKSAITYSQAFKLNTKGISADDFYNAACSWALCNVPDNAFSNLFRLAAEKKYRDIGHLSNDNNLMTLHLDKRWPNLITLVKDNKSKIEANFNRPLVKILDTVLFNDQQDRIKMDEVEIKYGYESKEMKELLLDMKLKDSLNLLKVSAIINKYGWLGADIIGNEGNEALFLVIQHSDHETHERYLPIIQKAVKEGYARPASLALLEDRTALEEGRKQIYGSQVATDPKTGKNSFYPIEDELNVDTRRREVGLMPLKEYAKLFSFDYLPPRGN